MKAKTAASRSRPVSLLRILGVLVPVAIIVFLTLGQANFLLSRALLIAFGDAESTYRSAWFEWDGDVVAKDLVVHPYGIDDATSIRFERLHLETPGWFWFVRNTFDRKLKYARLDRIHLTLSGGSSDSGLDPSLGDLGPFGMASASPFEAEGCSADTMWAREELIQMGLHPELPRLEFDYRAEGTELATTIVLESRGASRVQLDRRAQLPTEVNVLLLDQYPELTQSERWEVQDQGFVSARNRFCAKKDGIDGRRFLERHVQSVERLLDTMGLGVDDATRTAYRRFARDGGKLVFGGSYTPPLHSDEIYDLRSEGEAWPRMSATIDHNDRPAAVQWRRFAPRPLPGLDDGEPTFALLEKEQAAAMRARVEAGLPADAALATTAPAAAVAAPAAGTTPASTGADDPRLLGTTRGTSDATADVVRQNVAPVGAVPPTSTATTTSPASASTALPPPATPAASPPPAVAATSTSTLASTSPPATVATPPISTSPLPAPVAPAEAAGEPRAGARLAWEDLPAYRGRLVRIWTVHNPPRTVEVLSADAESLRVSARLGGGNAEYTVQRPGFIRARLVR
jgi:hypothetical protein